MTVTTDSRPGPQGCHLLDSRIRVVAASVHAGDAAVLVRRLKYGRLSAAVSPLADAMADVAPPADLITWVPASRSRRRERGFDQSELLARAVARRLRVPVRRALRRVDDSPQTTRSRDGRALGPDLTATGRWIEGGTRVLLVDDVVTTGATLQAAAEALAGHGAAEVVGLVATRVVGRAAGRPAGTAGAGKASGPVPVGPASSSARGASPGRAGAKSEEGRGGSWAKAS